MASIFIIQNKDVVRALFREILERAGHVVDEAAEAMEGVRRIRESPSDLLITDVHMPDSDGLEIIAMLRQEFPSAKILAVSAQTGKEEMLNVSKMLGADAVLQDAFDGEDLIRTVGKLLDAT